MLTLTALMTLLTLMTDDDFDNFDGFDKFDDSDVIDNVCQRDLLDFRRYLSTPVLKKLKKNYFVDHLRNGACSVLVVVQFEK